jgi:hypothetical protein
VSAKGYEHQRSGARDRSRQRKRPAPRPHQANSGGDVGETGHKIKAKHEGDNVSGQACGRAFGQRLAADGNGDESEGDAREKPSEDEGEILSLQ